jgi:acyl CoA:acetate/3-ketoacid CoA transferase
MDAQTVIAKRIALELRDGMLVNLGIGIPTQVANYVPAGIRVFFQSENGLIGTGAPPEEGMQHRLLTDAGGRPVTALPGASTFDSATSFGLIRGGHVDMTVLGGLQVDQSVLGLEVHLDACRNVVGDPGRNADAEVDERAVLEFERDAFGDNGPGVHGVSSVQ